MNILKAICPIKTYLVSILPKMLYIFILISPAILFSPKGFIRSLYPMVILLGLCNSWRAFLWITGIFFISVPASLFFSLSFHAPLNETLWLITTGSNLIEASDYVISNAVLPTVSTVVFIGFWAFFYKHLSGPVFRKTGWRIAACALLIVPAIHIVKKWPNSMLELNHHFTESYPWNALLSYNSAQQELSSFSKLKVDDSSLHISSSPLATQTLVLVIGESARRDRLQIYGATTPNSPELTRLSSELTVFSNVITLHPHTMASVPVMLTKDGGLKTPSPMDPSFIQLFKKAGYKVFWISNQSSLGGGSNRIGYYARTADYSKFFHIYEGNNPTSYDREVLEDFNIHLSDPEPKKLFVLHLQGSHYGFERRYPGEFNKFDDKYDNTLLYTDYILGEVINKLKQQDKPNALIYLSDHGLLLNQCNEKYTHFDNRESFEIPFIVWTSKDWNTRFPKPYKNLLSNLSNSYTTEYLFDSIADLAGIEYNNTNPLSVLQPYTQKPSRLVKTYSSIVNYDTGKNDDHCHLRSN